MYCEVSYTRSKLYNTTKNLRLLKLLVIFLPPQKRSALKTLLKEDVFAKEEVKVWIVFLFFFYLHPLVQHEITIKEFPEVFQEVAHTSYNSASSDEENNPPVPRQKVECVFSNMAAHTVSSKHFVL